MTSPGFFVGNSTTMATTPLPNRMRTNVPRNSATSSAAKPGFEVIASPSETAYVDREVVYQARGPAGLIFFDIGRNRGAVVGRPNPLHPICIDSSIPTTGELVAKVIFWGRFFLDIWGQAFKIGHIYSRDWIFIQ